jgi:asparagine synthase (glutamine-hydrolysing)
MGRVGSCVVLAPQLELVSKALGFVKLNLDALADALAFAAPLGNSTLIEGIEVLPPAAYLVVDERAKTVKLTRYWSATEVLSAGSRPLLETRESLLAAFLEGFDSVEKRGPVTITLSGGIDSRCLLAAALHRGVDVSAFNCSFPGSRSALYAKRMAAITGTSFEASPVGLEFSAGYGGRLEEVIKLTSGLTFSSEAEAHWLRELVPNNSTILHGAFAELSKLESMHTYFVDKATDRTPPEGLLELLWKRLEVQVTRSLACFAPCWRAELRERARANLEVRLRNIDTALPSEDRLQVLYLEEFLGKITRCGSLVWNDRVNTRFPFAWPRYLDLVLQTSAADRRTQKTQMYLLQRMAPGLFNFPDANTGLRVDAPRVLTYGTQLFDKVRRVLSLGRTAFDHSNVRYWITHMQPAPEELLRPNDCSALDILIDPLETGRMIELLRHPPPSSNPVQLVRQRMEQYSVATSIQKALMLRAFLSQFGATII